MFMLWTRTGLTASNTPVPNGGSLATAAPSVMLHAWRERHAQLVLPSSVRHPEGAGARRPCDSLGQGTRWASTGLFFAFRSPKV
jgi:hypothetical protein